MNISFLITKLLNFKNSFQLRYPARLRWMMIRLTLIPLQHLDKQSLMMDEGNLVFIQHWEQVFRLLISASQAKIQLDRTFGIYKEPIFSWKQSLDSIIVSNLISQEFAPRRQ